MTEYEALATAAVKALEAANTPIWTDIFGAIGAIGARCRTIGVQAPRCRAGIADQPSIL